jgi:poly-gamma-glutamate synthesis protein (capsule biosynthesis protein)
MIRNRQSSTSRITQLFCLVPILVFITPLQEHAVDAAANPWFYLRRDLQPGPAESLVEIIAVGDVMPGREGTSTRGSFDLVSSELEGADFVIGNLEGAITNSAPPDSQTTLFLPPGTQQIIADAGFDLLSLANNHSKDAGFENYKKTGSSLQAVNIQPLAANQSLIREIKGLKIAFLAWNVIPLRSNTSLITSIKALRTKVDVIILQIHWGQEYQRHPNWYQRQLAAELVEAGVDIVLGSHPHVVQDLQVEQSGSKQDRSVLVAYSLGNFIFDQGWGDTRQGLGLRLLLDRNGLRAAQALPVWSTLRPRWMSGADAEDLLKRVLPVERTGYSCGLDSCRTVQVPNEDSDGRYWSG